MTALLLACAASSEVHAAGVRVRWRPSLDARVVGYNVYVRPAGVPYGKPLDAGLPTPRPDGTMAFAVAGLAAGRNYFISIATYLADRTEGSFSQELSLAPTDPCAVDSCSTPRTCQFASLPDGTQCDDQELCSACRAGVCGGGLGFELVASRVRLRAGSNVSQISVFGSFPPPHVFQPTVTGLTLTLGDPTTGIVLYEAVIPGSSLEETTPGRQYRVTQTPTAAPGRVRLRLWLQNGIPYLKVRATAADLRPFLPLSQLAWSVRLGNDHCAEQSSLPCMGNLGFAVCR